jgi:zinc protease
MSRAHRVTRIAAAAVVVLLSCAGGGAKAAKLFDASEFKLDNGLDVVVIPNHRAPIITQMVWYKVGAADEVAGKSGLAHFLEHLMFRGTKETPPGDFSRIIAENGGQENAFTTHDYTAFYQNVAADRLDLVMKLEAERMRDLVISDTVLIPERKVIIEERHMRIDNSPSGLMNEQLDTALYLNHPYRIPTIGWEVEMRGLDTEDAQAFYAKWYHPNNAVLVIGGDVTVEHVHELAEKYFGPIPAQAVPVRHRVDEPPKVAKSRLTMTSERVAQPNWTLSFLAPSYTRGETKYAYALQVLAEVMGGGPTSRLYKALVVDHTVALDAAASYDPGTLDLSSFSFYGSPRKDVTVEAFEAEVEEQMSLLLKDGVTEEEVDRAKKRMQLEAVFARDSLTAPAHIVGAALATGRSLDEVESWADRIGTVTRDEVNEAAKLVIHDDVGVTGIMLPKPNS